MNDETKETYQVDKNAATGLLTDDQGKRSMMRLMSFTVLIEVKGVS